MKKTTEVTVQVFDTFENIDKILKNQGFVVTDRFCLTDWYFSKNDVKSIKYEDLISQSFLVRQFICDDKTELKLCYKNKKFDKCGNVISEEKTECYIDNLSSALKIFDNIHLNNWCVLKNQSFTYSDGHVNFDLQLIDELGIFIEYEEVITEKDLSVSSKLESMKKYLQKFNLDLGDDFFCKKVYMKFMQSNLSK